MKIHTAILALNLICFSTVPSLVQAEPLTRIDGVPVGIGDSVADVKAELQTDLEPEVMETNPPAPPAQRKTFIHLKTKGIWAFFNHDGKVDTVRLEAPFASTVGGVRIGDKLANVKATLGEPVKKPFTFGPSLMAYIYVLNDVVTLRVDIDKSDDVETIYLIK